MNKAIKVIYLLTLSYVLVDSSPKFGERLSGGNNTLIDSVFRPSHSQNNNRNQGISVSKISSKQQNEKTSKDEQKPENLNNEKIGEKFEERKIFLKTESQESNATPKQIEDSFGLSPDFDTFETVLSAVPELAVSQMRNSPPIPPQSPRVPQKVTNLESFHVFPNVNDFEKSGTEQSFYESAPKHSLNTEFSMNIPKGFPHPNHIRNAVGGGYKQEQMGTQNYQGKPWGTKQSYTYRDPKNAHNFMEMSEVTMTINRPMDPQEAQSQINKFILAAQNGQYGPLSPIKKDEGHNQANMDDTYEGEASYLAPTEPLEPTEPKFDGF